MNELVEQAGIKALAAIVEYKRCVGDGTILNDPVSAFKAKKEMEKSLKELEDLMIERLSVNHTLIYDL
jgi:hypothetical protein